MATNIAGLVVELHHTSRSLSAYPFSLDTMFFVTHPFASTSSLGPAVDIRWALFNDLLGSIAGINTGPILHGDEHARTNVRENLAEVLHLRDVVMQNVVRTPPFRLEYMLKILPYRCP
jgi:hypothetical protein